MVSTALYIANDCLSLPDQPAIDNFSSVSYFRLPRQLKRRTYLSSVILSHPAPQAYNLGSLLPADTTCTVFTLVTRLMTIFKYNSLCRYGKCRSETLDCKDIGFTANSNPCLVNCKPEKLSTIAS